MENISVWHSYVREGLGISGEDLPFRFDYYAQEIAAVIAANKLLSERVAVLETALDTANTALEDWLHKYAPDECKQERVEETKKRISDAGGTLAYLADVFATIRLALAAREAK